MNPWIGWGLAAAAVLSGWAAYGWPGVALAVTCIVFWMLLQFNRAMRVMRMAAARPVGTVDSAVMLHSRLQPGMTMLEILPLARSLGRAVQGEQERFEWVDGSGASVRVEMAGGRLARHDLVRHPPPDGPSDHAGQAAAGPEGQRCGGGDPGSAHG